MKLLIQNAGLRIRGAFSEQAFGRAIMLLISGNVISQIIVFFALPVITRIYAPEHLSLLAVYVAILTMISVIACMRLEIAIPIPKSDETAVNLAALALLSALIVTVLVTLVLLAIAIADIQHLTGHPLWQYAWLFPLGTLFSGLFLTAQFWSIRQKRFFLIGRTRVFQAIVGTTTQIAAGMLQIIPFGLLLGHLLMTSAGSLGLFFSANSNDRHIAQLVSREKMRRALLEYKDFPKFSVIEGLATTGAQQITIILIVIFNTGAEAGFFFLAMRAMNAPISLVTNSLSQAYLQKAPGHLRNGTLREFTKKLLFLIAIAFLPLFAIFGFFSVTIFEVVFGSEWTRAGEIAVILLPMFLLSLFSASIGMVMNVTGQQKRMMQLKLMGFLLRVGGLLVAALVAPENLIEAYAASSTIVLLIYFWVFYSASAQYNNSERMI